MQSPVGLIPAAGVGSRLGGRGSKEIVPIAPGRGPRRRPAISWLLEAMGAAGIETAYVVLRRGKWDVPERLLERGDAAPRLGYIVTEATRSIPESLDRARPFVGGRDVLLGFPDILFQPARAAADLLAARRRTGRDVMVALLPSDRPDKTDMVELDGDRITGFRVKPGPSELVYTWVLAAWGERFTGFLGDHLRRTGGRPPGGPLAELQVSQVLAAALDEGLTIGGCRFDDGTFIDVGTPEDLARARRDAPRARPVSGP